MKARRSKRVFPWKSDVEILGAARATHFSVDNAIEREPRNDPHDEDVWDRIVTEETFDQGADEW